MDNIDENIYKAFFDIKNVLCIKKDIKGNIVYPNTKNELKLYKELLESDIKGNDQFYHRNSKTWYKRTIQLVNENDEIISVEYFEDITELKNEIYNLKLDKLTNLLKDREEINDLINDYIEYATKENEEFSLIMADVDKFKRINDNYGHKCGDYVLQNVGFTLLNNTRQSPDKFDQRPSDIVARIGGDEFLILLKNITLEETKKKIKEIKNRIKQLNIKYYDKKVKVNISIGYCHMKKVGSYKNTTIKKLRETISDIADDYLYMEKKEKKNIKNEQLKQLKLKNKNK